MSNKRRLEYAYNQIVRIFGSQEPFALKNEHDQGLYSVEERDKIPLLSISDLFPRTESPKLEDVSERFRKAVERHMGRIDSDYGDGISLTNPFLSKRRLGVYLGRNVLEDPLVANGMKRVVGEIVIRCPSSKPRGGQATPTFYFGDGEGLVYIDPSSFQFRETLQQEHPIISIHSPEEATNLFIGLIRKLSSSN